MKKTLLAVALLFASSSIFAQINTQEATATHQQKVLSQKISEMYTQKPAKKTAVKAYPTGIKLLTDFSDENSYELKTGPRNSANGEYCKWKTIKDTNNVWSSTNFIVKNFFGLNKPGNWHFLEDSTICNMSAHNGFAYIDFLSIWQQDQQNNAELDLCLQLKNPIKTYGKRGVDIYLSQFLMKFNQDQYFIEWSHTSDFTIKDSFEYNLRNLDVATNEYIWGTVRVTLPTNTTNCKLISTDANEDTYFRIRVTVPASAFQPHGYMYMIDDIAWTETPEYRLDVKKCDFYGGYHQLPDIVKAEPFNVQVRVDNSGSQDLYNVTLQNIMVQGNVLEGQAFDGSDSIDYNFKQDTVINSGKQDTLKYLEYEVASKDANKNDIKVLRSYEYLQAYSTSQLNKGKGIYGVKNKLKYSIKEGEALKDTVIDASPYDYHYSVRAADSNGVYRWGRDCSGTTIKNAFKYGYHEENGNVYIADAQTDIKGYKVCLGFNAQEYKENAYAWGVELYPALDSVTYKKEENRNVKAGAIIKASLWKYDHNANENNDAVVLVKDDKDNALESEPYVVQTSDYNTIEKADKLGRLTVSDMKSIYLPFKSQGTVLQPNTIYYACYEQVVNGKFKVAENNNNYLNVFFPGASLYKATIKGSAGQDTVATVGLNNVVVWSPNITKEGVQFTWGAPFAYNYTPFIRLVIANKKGGLNNVAENNASVSLFPNPVADRAVLDYTLTNSGRVTINVTDIMGRTVLTYDEGNRHAGINNKANIESDKLSNGTYFCTINVNGAKVKTTKFVVSK